MLKRIINVPVTFSPSAENVALDSFNETVTKYRIKHYAYMVNYNSIHGNNKMLSNSLSGDDSEESTGDFIILTL